MNKIKFLRILLFAFLSFSIISCTTTEEHYYYITPGDGSQTSGTGDGSQTPGTEDGSQTPGTGDGSQTPGTGDGSQTPETGDGSQTPGIPGDGNKKLVQMNQINDGLDGAKYYFKYNENGALAEVTIFEYDEYDQILETISNNYYKWTATELFLSHDKYSYESLCEISNGRIVRDTYPNKYMYDANGYLINRNREGNDETYTWKEGRLMSYVFKYDGGGWGYTKTLKYIYSPNSKKVSNGFFPNVSTCNSNFEYEFFAIPWVIGMEQQDLPQEIEREYINWSNAGGSSTSESKYVYDYTFYDDGYLKSCTERELGETYSYTTVYEYFWE